MRKRPDLAERNRSNRKYKLEDKRLVNIWRAMHHRCESSLDKAYKWYGERGVCVCEEWAVFENFKQWAISNGYSDNLTIDRIDTDKNYCPENCRWVNMVEQNNNRSSNKMIEFQGRKQSLAEWCRELNLNYSRTKARINACHWTVEEAFTKERYTQVNISNQKK